jgi:hypothetical protein
LFAWIRDIAANARGDGAFDLPQELSHPAGKAIHRLVFGSLGQFVAGLADSKTQLFERLIKIADAAAGGMHSRFDRPTALVRVAVLDDDWPALCLAVTHQLIKPTVGLLQRAFFAPPELDLFVAFAADGD